jgi:glycosyltransferase involved in cell wall biosynthesis
MFSLVIPVYETDDSLAHLLEEIDKLAPRIPDALELVFVVDGRRNNTEFLHGRLPEKSYRWQLITLSRNFGAWPATYAGLHRARGDYLAVISADLQETPGLIVQFAELLKSGATDIVLARRDARADPPLAILQSKLFYAIYRRFVVKEMPQGGVDVFAFTRAVRDVLLNFKEADTNFVSLLLWIGFRREIVSYTRAPRLHGRSSWSFAKKLRQAFNSIFNFTDLPLQILLFAGGIGFAASVVIGALVLYGRIVSGTHVPGYAAIILALLFFGGLISMGLGILGQYVWLILQNVRNRPSYLIESVIEKNE